MTITKSTISTAAAHGGRLTIADVAAVNRRRGTITMRHSWEGEDGRAVDAVMRLAREAARDMAAATGRRVEVHGRRGGWLIDVIEPA